MLIILFTKARFRPLLSPFIARFILIIVKSIFGMAHFRSLQNPSKNGQDKGLKWGSGPLNSTTRDQQFKHDYNGKGTTLKGASKFCIW